MHVLALARQAECFSSSTTTPSRSWCDFPARLIAFALPIDSRWPSRKIVVRTETSRSIAATTRLIDSEKANAWKDVIAGATNEIIDTTPPPSHGMRVAGGEENLGMGMKRPDSPSLPWLHSSVSGTCSS